MPPPGAGKFSAFDRLFDPEYLLARVDITPVMLHCAQGDMEKVVNHLTAPGERNDLDIFSVNRDGNTLLLLSVANQHYDISKLLLEMQSDLGHKNGMHLDALDYAAMDGVRNPIAKLLFSYCEYVVPTVVEGPFWSKSLGAVQQLQEAHIQVARTSLIGRTPEFLRTKLKDQEYTRDWVRDLNFIVGHVRRGMLLLSSEVGYLERDAMRSGALEVPMDHRFVYQLDEGKAMRFRVALKSNAVYGEALSKRVIDMCLAGDADAVRGLLRASAPADPADAFGHTALMRAAQRGATEVIAPLLKANARVDGKSNDGYTALLMASVNNHGDAVQMLVRARANPQVGTVKGNTVLSFIKHEGNTDVLDIVRQERARSSRSRRRSTSSSKKSNVLGGPSHASKAFAIFQRVKEYTSANYK